MKFTGSSLSTTYFYNLIERGPQITQVVNKLKTVKSFKLN